MNGGDQLARGAKSATFPASEGKISQEKWDAIFGEPAEDVKGPKRGKKNDSRKD